MNLSVNSMGDIELDRTTNNLKVVRNTEEIRQIILQNLETIAGEWFLDTSLGVPWFTEILQKNVTLSRIDGVLIEEITRSQGVISLISYNSSFDARERLLSVEFTAETVFGILNFSQNIAG